MSTDPQIKKRRDNKKKRKDDASLEDKENPIEQITPKTTLNGDVNIHVHREPSTGGGFCAKLVFFVLLFILGALIAVLFNEHREFDVISTSRFSNLGKGSLNELALSAEESAEQNYEEDELVNEDYEHETETRSEELSSMEENESGGEEGSEDNKDDVENTEEENKEDTEEENESTTPNESTEASDEVSDDRQIAEEENELEDQEDALTDSELDKSDSTKIISNEDKSDDDDEFEERVLLTKQAVKDQSIEPDDLELENEDHHMMIKFGVGTALVVVAYTVLIQKRRTPNVDKPADPKTYLPENDSECSSPNLSRRNTIVIPPSLLDVQCDIENVEEEYTQDDAESENNDDNCRSKQTKAQKRYQELQYTYSNMLTPEWEPQHLQKRLMEDCEIDDIADTEEAEDEEELEEEDDNGDISKEISDSEDEDLLRRLEKKYGKLQNSDSEVEIVDDDNGENDDNDENDNDDDENEFDSWKRVRIIQDNSESESGHESNGPEATYTLSNITNADDWSIKDSLDQADRTIEHDAAYALTIFNKLLEKHPFSPRALYGKARCLEVLAEKKRSNSVLQEAISTLQGVLNLPNVLDPLFQIAAERCIDRMRFRGRYLQAVSIHMLLITRFSNEIKYRNELVVTYLTMNRISEAKNILQGTLSKWPNDGFALVHYGFILKTHDNDLEKSALFLQQGISTKAPGVIDGRFYFHLGDALSRLGRKVESLAVYEDGVANGLFLSKYQRSLYNVPRLKAKPWWSIKDFSQATFFEYLEKNWRYIRNEGLGILNKQGNFKPETENLREMGEWKQFELYARGIKNVANCKQCPMTCEIMSHFPEASTCKRGQIKFSVMHPGTHVWPHCGPTNCRLRTHLGLKVPKNTYIRVADEIRSWEEGKLLIFDDSFEHEVWHNGSSVRLVLIIDIWHPELTQAERQSLSSI